MAATNNKLVRTYAVNVNCASASYIHVHVAPNKASDKGSVRVEEEKAAASEAVGKLVYIYLALKPEQERTIVNFLKGNEVFVSLPTGYGKTLCWWQWLQDVTYTVPAFANSCVYQQTGY